MNEADFFVEQILRLQNASLLLQFQQILAEEHQRLFGDFVCDRWLIEWVFKEESVAYVSERSSSVWRDVIVINLIPLQSNTENLKTMSTWKAMSLFAPYPAWLSPSPLVLHVNFIRGNPSSDDGEMEVVVTQDDK